MLLGDACEKNGVAAACEHPERPVQVELGRGDRPCFRIRDTGSEKNFVTPHEDAIDLALLQR